VPYIEIIRGYFRPYPRRTSVGQILPGVGKETQGRNEVWVFSVLETRCSL
jgi:hypothetical protein